jgi:hypothetical protein
MVPLPSAPCPAPLAQPSATRTATAAEVLGVADLVDGSFSKRREPEVGVDFAVDDDAPVVGSNGGYRVEPFGGDPGDEGLLRAGL